MAKLNSRFPRPEIIVFDIYETLLDMADTERKINAFTESKRGYIIWLELFMQYCFADNCLDTFHDFLSIARATLQMAGYHLGRNIPEREISDVLENLKHLPLHEDVQSGLSQLRDRGYRIAALTNAPEKIVCDRMERTGLISYFEQVLSAETVRKYKPQKETYRLAAQKLHCEMDRMLMVTSHAWDISGAANAGMRTVLLERNGELVYPLSAEPEAICNSLPDLVDLLDEMDKKGTD